MFLEISQNSLENTCARVSFLIKLQDLGNLIKKETLAQVLSCKFCEISKNTFCTEHLWTTASGWFPEDFKAQNLGSKENEKLSFYLFTDILWIINTEKSCRHYYSSFSQSLPSTQAST